MIGTLSCVVIDCPDPRALADFYEQLTGLRCVRTSEAWVTLGDIGQPPRLALQRVADFVAPGWRSPLPPQQMHLDVLVDDLDLAQEEVLKLGGTLIEGSDKSIGYRVYADPVVHPFCLVTPDGLT